MQPNICQLVVKSLILCKSAICGHINQMKSYQIVADNLAKLYELTGLKSARLCAIAKDKGLTLSTSTLSRFLNGSNTSVETLDSLAEAISSVAGFSWVTQSHLLKPNVFDQDEKSSSLNVNTLSEHYSKLFIELNEIGWVKLNQKVNMDSIVDFSIHTFKKAGFEVDEQSFETASLRSGS